MLSKEIKAHSEFHCALFRFRWSSVLGIWCELPSGLLPVVIVLLFHLRRGPLILGRTIRNISLSAEWGAQKLGISFRTFQAQLDFKWIGQLCIYFSSIMKRIGLSFGRAGISQRQLLNAQHATNWLAIDGRFLENPLTGSSRIGLNLIQSSCRKLIDWAAQKNNIFHVSFARQMTEQGPDVWVFFSRKGWNLNSYSTNETGGWTRRKVNASRRWTDRVSRVNRKN